VRRREARRVGDEEYLAEGQGLGELWVLLTELLVQVLGNASAGRGKERGVRYIFEIFSVDVEDDGRDDGAGHCIPSQHIAMLSLRDEGGRERGGGGGGWKMGGGWRGGNHLDNVWVIQGIGIVEIVTAHRG
jgi:hypothetical protein